jgi:hypothetical protein
VNDTFSLLPLPKLCTARPLTWLALALLALPAAPGLQAADTAYRGVCDGSAAVALDAQRFVAASDEDNVLRIYRRGSGALPEQTFDMSALLQADPKHPESDLEGAARLGDVVYWIASHSRSRSGKERAGRGRFFATRFLRTETGWKVELVGRARADLLEFLTTYPGLGGLKLAEAATRSPKEKDALNIEGLCATPEGHLLIAFRNPIRGGKAVLAPLLNPSAFVAGAKPEFGPPLKLDLGGLGFRDMVTWRGGYLIAAGAARGGGKHQLWFWAGGAVTPQQVTGVDLAGLDAEAIVVYSGAVDSVELLSDDSGEATGGTDCKQLPAAQRRFRSLTVRLPDGLGGPYPATTGSSAPAR